jgi:signal transduction histidine kinase
VGAQLLSISVLNLQTERSADLGAIIVLRDKSAEQRLEKIKVDFVANASHELKTPLTVIKAVTVTLNDDPEMPKEDRHRFLTRIMEQAERLTAIVQDLFKLSRFDAFATDQPKFEIITLNKIVARAVEDRASSAEEHRIAIVFNPHSLEKVRGDEEALRQLIVNLLDNALQYGPEGTSISVGLESDSTDIYLSVSDQGPGIAAVHQSRVFERFYRVDGARARRDGGTGLGLSIVKNIATSHGGSVSLKSDVGQGSTFTLRLAKVVETSE